MIALVQRVRRASVAIEGEPVGAIGRGILVLLGIHREDTHEQMEWLVRKCANLRIFPDDEEKMNRSVVDVAGDALVVSQFTLYGSVERGNRPSFGESAPPEVAEPLYERFASRMSELLDKPVATGRFGAMMDVELINEGPVTIWIERAP